VLAGETAAQRGRRESRIGMLAQRVTAPQSLGCARIPALAFLLILVSLALGVPVGSAVYWILRSRDAYLTGVSLIDATWHTAAYAACAAAVATLMALPLALLAMPGLVIALALSYFTERYADGFLYQSAPLLVLAYAILFFPLALVGVRASVLQAPPQLEELGRSLGVPRVSVTLRVTLPLIAPGLTAAFCLVFLSAVTELTATLILVPTGVQTLATQFWAYQQNLAYGQAAPFALAIIAIAAIPSALLGRFFDRMPARSPVAA
jgi:iron(III) transport system permease protein